MKYERTIAIADIHGCLKELKKLLETVNPVKGKDHLVILGDVIDRGYDSEGVIRLLLEYRDTLGEENMIWLPGNHEDQLIQRNRKKLFCKKDTSPLDKYSHLFSQLSFCAETEECIFAHAGFNGDPYDRQCLLYDRSVLSGKRHWPGKLCICGHSPFDSGTIVPFAKPVYIDENGNRSSVTDGMPVPKKGSLFIDTGCVYKNCLTALIINHSNSTLHFVSVPFEGV